jgi:hypothetical protein
MKDIEYQPQTPKETAWQMLMIRLGVAKRNRADQRRAALTSAKHYADAAATMLARVGRGK